MPPAVGPLPFVRVVPIGGDPPAVTVLQPALQLADVIAVPQTSARPVLGRRHRQAPLRVDGDDRAVDEREDAAFGTSATSALHCGDCAQIEKPCASPARTMTPAAVSFA